jgi:hypothetical protein
LTLIAAARIAAAMLLLALAGCTAVPPPKPPARPPLTALPDVPPNFLVPPLRDRMVYLARQEWTLFSRPTLVRGADGDAKLAFAPGVAESHEAQPPMLSRVLLYWYAVTREPIVGEEGELRPWSAAFVSWLVRSADLGGSDFPATVLHWDYIQRFRSPGRFATRDPRSYAPRVGDLVCTARDETIDGFDALRPGPYHCDLVVAAQPGAIEAIGGNLGDTVASTRFDTDARGLLLALPGRPWAAVLELRE